MGTQTIKSSFQAMPLKDGIEFLSDQLKGTHPVEFFILKVIKKRFELHQKNFGLGIITSIKLREHHNKATEQINSLCDEIMLRSDSGYPRKKKVLKSIRRIFLSYCWADSAEAELIDRELTALGVDVIRDIRGLTFTSSISDFMKRIRKTDFAIILASPDYLRSFNCMKEVLYAFENSNFKKRLLPIVKDFGILHPESNAEIIAYWDKQDSAGRKRVKNISSIHSIGLNIQAKETHNIYTKADDILSYLRDTLLAKLTDLRATNYKAILDRIGISEYVLAFDSNRAIARNYVEQALIAKSTIKKIKLLSRAIELDKTYREAYEMRGNLLCQLEIFDMANIDLFEASRLMPPNAILLNKLGIVNRRICEYRTAIQNFNKAIAQDKNCKQAYNNRGLTWDSLGQYNEAIIDYDLAIGLDQTFVAAYSNKAYTLQKMGNYDEAIQVLMLAKQINANYGFIYANLAEIYALQGNKEEFLKNIKIALEHKCPVSAYLDDVAYQDFLKDPDFVALLQQLDSSSQQEKHLDEN